MDKISGLPDDLLVKILSFLPTKDAFSTSILSKQWQFLWLSVPKLEYDICDFQSNPALQKFMNKNLPLHRAPVIERFSMDLRGFPVELNHDIKLWAGITVSRCVQELKIHNTSYSFYSRYGPSCLPDSLFTCKTLVTLILSGDNIFVDVPQVVSLPSLKTLKLEAVTYSNQDSLRLLLSYCLILEDLDIKRCEKGDNLGDLVVTVPSLQRLSLDIDRRCYPSGYFIVTPSLKYFKFHDARYNFSYMIEHMPNLEEADINARQNVEKLLESITTVNRLSLSAFFNSGEESMYPAGIVFNQLEHLKLRIDDYRWPDLLSRLLEDSPKLRDLSVYSYCFQYPYAFSWNDISVPKCLLESFESFKFEGYGGTLQARDFLSFLFKNARRLKSSLISEKYILD